MPPFYARRRRSEKKKCASSHRRASRTSRAREPLLRRVVSESLPSFYPPGQCRKGRRSSPCRRRTDTFQTRRSEFSQGRPHVLPTRALRRKGNSIRRREERCEGCSSRAARGKRRAAALLPKSRRASGRRGARRRSAVQATRGLPRRCKSRARRGDARRGR